MITKFEYNSENLSQSLKTKKVNILFLFFGTLYLSSYIFGRGKNKSYYVLEQYTYVVLYTLGKVLKFQCILITKITYSATIEYRQLKFAVKIPMTYAHLVYKLFGPLVLLYFATYGC